MSILDDAREGMDPEVRPQDDLFGHVNGRWLDEADIPSDRSSWGPFVQLADVAEEQVHRIIEDLAAIATDADEGTELNADAQKIGDLFASFMDTDRIDRLGARPIKPLMDAVASLRDVATWRRSSASSSGSAATGSSAPTSTPTTATPTATCSTWCRAGSGCPTSPTTARTSSPTSGRSTSPT